VKPTKVIHRVVVSGLMMCGEREQDSGARGSISNKHVNCATCLAILKAKQDAAKRRAGVA
jgi:hypothetical protein